MTGIEKSLMESTSLDTSVQDILGQILQVSSNPADDQETYVVIDSSSPSLAWIDLVHTTHDQINESFSDVADQSIDIVFRACCQ